MTLFSQYIKIKKKLTIMLEFGLNRIHEPDNSYDRKMDMG